jgi:hypothetical protein
LPVASYLKACLLPLLIALASEAAASSWNLFPTVYHEKVLFFFDADSVSRQGQDVVLWIKTVNIDEPMSDGATWSMSTLYAISCTQRTFRTRTISVYDRGGKFIRSMPGAAESSDIRPDSLMEVIMGISCSDGFPKAKNEDLYYPANNNDPLGHTRTFVEERNKERAKK